MDPYSPSNGRARPRLGWLGLLLLLAFAAGAALALWGARRFELFRPAARPAAQAVAPVRRQPAPQPVVGQADLAALTARAVALSGELAGLEARAALLQTDAQRAGGEAGRAEGVLLAAAVRRAIDRGTGLGDLEEPLRLRFGEAQPRAVEVVVDTARQPVTLEDLRAGLDTIAPQLLSGFAGEDWWPAFRRELGNLVVLRRAGTPSPLPADRLTRARRLLEGGQVEAAAAEVQAMPGAGRADAWMEAARRYLLAQRALDAVEAAAMRGQAAPAPGNPAGR